MLPQVSRVEQSTQRKPTRLCPNSTVSQSVLPRHSSVRDKYILQTHYHFVAPYLSAYEEVSHLRAGPFIGNLAKTKDFAQCEGLVVGFLSIAQMCPDQKALGAITLQRITRLVTT